MTDPLPACWSCGSERIGPTNNMMIRSNTLITCGDCGAGPDPEHIWRARALGPALDVVLAEAEAMEASGDVVIWGNDTDRIRIGWMRDLIAMLHALRDAHSPTATPSGSGAQPATGEAERGS